MSAVQALKAARAAGVKLGVDGNALTLEAATAPPPTVLDLLVRHKVGILTLLRPANDGWSGEDWLVFFDERIDIAASDGGLPRDQAEACAFEACVVEWLNRNPAHAMSDRCLGCGGSEIAHDTLLPFGTKPTGHAWLHSRCWPAWHVGRKAAAVAALAKLGITTSRANQ
jgi:hypothetical protein